MRKFCRREINFCICGALTIKSLKEFHSIIEESPQYVINEKKCKHYIVKCKIEDNNVADVILQYFGIRRKINIHTCFTTLSTKCRVGDNLNIVPKKRKKKYMKKMKMS